MNPMRRLLAGIMLLLSTGFWAGGCQMEEGAPKAQLNQVLAVTEGYLIGKSFGGLQLPDSTYLRILSASEVRLEFPNNTFFWDGTSLQNSFGYTCKCSNANEGGCSVVELKGTYGCSHDQNRCHGSCEGRSTGGVREAVSFNASEVGFIDLSSSISLITNAQEMAQLKPLPSSLLKSDVLLQMVSESNLPLEAPKPNEPIKYVPVNLFGYFAYIGAAGVPAKNSLEVGLKPQCKCQSGSTGCAPEDVWTPKGTVNTCKANDCNTCTML